jgi:hypothetical protein
VVDLTIIQELSNDLPKDPILAIAQFARNVKIIVPLRKQEENFSSKDGFAIISFFKKFMNKFSINIDISSIYYDQKETYSFNHVMGVADKIISAELGLLEDTIASEVDGVIGQYGANIDVNGFGFARLNATEKNKIHEHISRIRSLIDASDLPDRKKNALFERLNSLAGEVDQYGTRTDQFFAFMGDVAFVMGDMTNKAKPLIAEVKDMMKILSRSRARQEGVSLPPGDETVLLPPPEDEEA